jgi:hypothetical protein
MDAFVTSALDDKWRASWCGSFTSEGKSPQYALDEPDRRFVRGHYELVTIAQGSVVHSNVATEPFRIQKSSTEPLKVIIYIKLKARPQISRDNMFNKDIAIPVTGLGGTVGSQMAVRLSALRASRPLPSGRSLVLIFVRGWVDPRAIMWLEVLDQLKNPVISSGIEPATFRLVA